MWRRRRRRRRRRKVYSKNEERDRATQVKTCSAVLRS